MKDSVLCIDVGGTFIKYALVDGARRLSEQGKTPTPTEGLEAYLHLLEGLYRRFSGEASGIALSVPGIIDSARGVCVTAGALAYATGLALGPELSRRCGVPVTVMNDAKCAALAEASFGALAGCRDAAVIVLGTGVGGALIHDGRVHMGAHFAAGEFSAISLNADVDCLASLWAGTGGVARLCRLAAYARGADPAQVSGEDVFRWVEEGDAAVQMALDQYTATVARMICNLQVIFDPERFAIGGGISRQPKLLESIRKNIDYLTRICPNGMPKPEVTACQYFNEANLLGAYSYFLQVRAGQAG